MSLKIKQEKKTSGIDIAREKLEDALQTIVEKAGESPSTSEDESNKDEDVANKREPSPVSIPAKKPTLRAQRRRRRRDDTLNKNSNSYVLKLFDRAVDLTPFNEQTPLYRICRAWINNQELYQSDYQQQDGPEVESSDEANKRSEDTNSEDVYQLPPPIPSDGKNLRIPSPIPQPEEEFIVCSIKDENMAKSKELLMSKHLQRWKAVRQKWKKAAKANEERYHASAVILKDIFEKAQERDEVASLEHIPVVNKQIETITIN